MGKRVGLYLFVTFLIIGVFLIAYYMHLGITGFAVHQDDFSTGQHNGTMHNGTALVLNSSQNATSGDYTSKVFDAGSSVQWDNITFTGSQDLAFQVRNCSTSDCSDGTFASGNLSNLGLTGQYFQYKVFITSSDGNLQTVAIESSILPIVTSVSISEPTGTKTASTGIPLNYNVAGDNIVCEYAIHDASDDAVILSNTSLSGCSNITFDLGAGEGNYELVVYANGDSGLASATSAFTVGFPEAQETEEEETEEAQSTVQVPVIPQTIKELSASDIETATVAPGSTHDVRLSVRNSGTAPLTSCSIGAQGDLAAGVAPSGETVNLNVGDSHEFLISVVIPEETAEGQHTLSVSANCAETSATKDAVINVERKKIEFSIIEAQRTRDDRVRVVYSLQELTGADQQVEASFAILDAGNNVVASATESHALGANSEDESSVNIPIDETLEGDFSLSVTVNSEVYTTTVLEPITLGTPVGGFAVFGGLGAGSILIFLIVVVALAVVILVARRMRQGRENPIEEIWKDLTRAFK